MLTGPSIPRRGTGPRPTGGRRGLIAITFSLVMLLLIFSVVAAYLLTLLTAAMQTGAAQHSTAALYAAEAGLDVVLQTRQQGLTRGMVGAGRYVAQLTGNQVVALGAVPQASGMPVVATLTAEASPGAGIVSGTWRRAKAGEYPALRAQIIAEMRR